MEANGAFALCTALKRTFGAASTDNKNTNQNDIYEDDVCTQLFLSIEVHYLF